MGIIARQSMKASVVGLVGVAIGAVSKLFIFTHFLTTEEIGLLDVITKLTLLLITFFVLGAPQVVKRYYTFFSLKSEEGKLVYTYLKFLFLSIGLSSVLYLLLRPFIAEIYIGKSPLFVDYINIPLVCSILYAFYFFFNSISIAKKRIVVPAIFFQVLNRIMVVFTVVCYGYFGLFGVDGLVYWYVLSFFGIPFIGLVGYVLFFLKVKVSKTTFSESKTIFSHTKKYNLFLILSMASSYVVQAIDAQMISVNLGLASAGVYSIAFYMGAAIQIPQRAIANISFPILSEAFEEKRLDKVSKIYKESSLKQFLVGSFMFLVIWFNIDFIFAIIPNGEDFSIAKYVVLFIGLGKLFDMALGVNRQIIEISDKYKYNLLINITLSISVIVFNLIFIPMDNVYIGGINGAAFASMLAMIISNVIALIVLMYHYKLSPFTLKIFTLFCQLLIVFFILCGIKYLGMKIITDVFITNVVILIVFVILGYKNKLFNIKF